MKYTTISEIVLFVRDAVKRASGAGDMYKYGQRIFLIEDKKIIIEMVRNCLSTQAAIAGELACSWDDKKKWLGRFMTWGRAYNAGQLDVQRAVAIQRPKPVAATLEPISYRQLGELITALLERDGNVLEVQTICMERCGKYEEGQKVKLANDSLVDIEALLKSKGLTLDDLKNVL